MQPLPSAPQQFSRTDEQSVRDIIRRAVSDTEDALKDHLIQRGEVLKRVDETRTSTATVADDGALAAPLPANAKRFIRGTIFFDTAVAADFKWRHNGPAGLALLRLRRHVIIPGATAYSDVAVDTAYSAADIAVAGAGTNGGIVQFDAIIHNGATAGMFAFLWAQNTSDAGATIVRAGSLLEWIKIG
jgi:hypothetical protein